MSQGRPGHAFFLARWNKHLARYTKSPALPRANICCRYRRPDTYRTILGGVPQCIFPENVRGRAPVTQTQPRTFRAVKRKTREIVSPGSALPLIPR